MSAPPFDVTWLQSKQTGRRFPIAVLSGDTDSATDEWLPLTSVQHPEIVLVRLNPGERDDDAESRPNRTLHRDDLRSVKLKEVKHQTRARGLSFHELRRIYQRPKLTYSDIYAPQGDAEPTESVTAEMFVRGGGIVSELHDA